MDYRYLGSTGLRVSQLTLGVMNFGAWANTDADEADRVIATAIDAGINVIDTADVYSQGESERILGASLAKRTDRDELIIASKFHNPMGDGVNARGNSRHWIVRAVDASLSRLGLDHLDLYQVHRPESQTAIDETLGALSDLVRVGKIRYFGTSTFNGAELTEARWTAEKRGHVYPVSEQLPYSILAREAEREVLPVLAKYGLGALIWSPLAGGWLAGRGHVDGNSRIGRQPERHTLEVPENRAKLEAVEKLQALADELGVTLPQLGVAFVLANRVVSTVLIGPRTIEQLSSLLPAAELVLSPETLDRIDRIVAPGRTINPADTGYALGHVAALLRAQRA